VGGSEAGGVARRAVSAHLDDLTPAQAELKGSAAVVAAVELGARRLQRALVVDGDLVACPGDVLVGAVRGAVLCVVGEEGRKEGGGG
jgi:hypothetical protein